MKTKQEKIEMAKRWIEILRDKIVQFNIKIAQAEEWSVRRALVEDRMRAENNLEDWKVELEKIQTK